MKKSKAVESAKRAARRRRQDVREWSKRMAKNVGGHVSRDKKQPKLVVDLTATPTVTVPAYDIPPLPDRAMELLDAAKVIVSGARRKSYGTPEDNFRCIADMWMAFLGRKPDCATIVLEPADVAVMMVLMKCARLGETIDHADSALDIAGYAACLARCQKPTA